MKDWPNSPCPIVPKNRILEVPNDCLKSAQNPIKHSSDKILKKEKKKTYPRIFSIIERCFLVALVTARQRVSAHLAGQKHFSNSVDAIHEAAKQKCFAFIAMPLSMV